jgi:anti-sigma regulatory factor (Ser/Thr protein kinase)
LRPEEIFTNICRYAYAPESGTARIDVFMEPPGNAVVRLSDSGRPFDPLTAPAPDVSLPAEHREQGDLGIFMAQQLASHIHYKYMDGKNILTITKQKPTEAYQHGNKPK